MPTIQEQIKRVKEIMGVSQEKPLTENDHQKSYMAKSQLYNIAKKSQSMYDRLDNGEELADWMESKIAQMADNIDSVSHSFNYDEAEEDMSCGGTIEEDVMSGLQGGYPDTDDATSYDFNSKGALGSQSELSDEGFEEAPTNYSKEKKGYNFNSDGPEDSYMDSSDEDNMELDYELGEQEGTESGESDDGAGAGTASLGVWDSGIARGVANQVANTKWGDTYQTTRGKGNPVW